MVDFLFSRYRRRARLALLHGRKSRTGGFLGISLSHVCVASVSSFARENTNRQRGQLEILAPDERRLRYFLHWSTQRRSSQFSL